MIEMFWGAAKSEVRSNLHAIAGKILYADLIREVKKAFDKISIEMVRKFETVTARFHDADSKGLSGAYMKWVVRQFHGHRGLPNNWQKICDIIGKGSDASEDQKEFLAKFFGTSCAKQQKDENKADQYINVKRDKQTVLKAKILPEQHIDEPTPIKTTKRQRHKPKKKPAPRKSASATTDLQEDIQTLFSRVKKRNIRRVKKNFTAQYWMTGEDHEVVLKAFKCINFNRYVDGQFMGEELSSVLGQHALTADGIIPMIRERRSFNPAESDNGYALLNTVEWGGGSGIHWVIAKWSRKGDSVTVTVFDPKKNTAMCNKIKEHLNQEHHGLTVNSTFRHLNWQLCGWRCGYYSVFAVVHAIVEEKYKNINFSQQKELGKMPNGTIFIVHETYFFLQVHL